MSNTAEKIKSKGYWRVIIRPATYSKERVANILELFPLVQRLSIQIRGWDFPHIDINTNPKLGTHSVGQEVDWSGIVERWQLYQSGQFIYMGAFLSDWGFYRRPVSFADQNDGPFLLVEDCVARYSEFMEFSSRLALSPAGDQRVFIEIGAHNLSGRQLLLASRRGGFLRPFSAATPEFVKSQEFNREELVAESRQIGLEWARELFRRFGWDPSAEILESIRSEYR